MNYCLTLLTCLFTISLSAQQTVEGIVRDAKTKETVIGAIVYVDSITKAGTTDIDGKYSIPNISKGKHTLFIKLISYKTIQKTIEVGDQPVVTDAAMETEEKTFKEVEVKTTKRTNTESSVVMEVKKASSIVSGISASQIQKTADRNAADVVKRIPGVTIQDDRFINIRGLSERYNSVWLNDASAPSAESDQRAFSFDVIPSGMIDRIMIFKSPSPDLPGDFAGGMVKIYTQSIPDKTSFQAGYSTSFRTGSTFEPYSYTQRSKTDLLGFDNGYRGIPDGTPAYVSKNDSNIQAISRAFPNNWKVQTVKLVPDQRANIGFQGLIKKGNFKFGSTTSLSYTMAAQTLHISRQDYDSTSQNYNYSDEVSSRKVTLSGMQNFAVLFGNQKLEWKTLVNQQGTESTTQRTSNRVDFTPEKYYGLGYQARTTVMTQLCGDHHFNNDKTIWTYSNSYSYSMKNEPDLRRILYTKTEPDTVYQATIANTVDPFNGGGRLYQKLKEQVFSTNQQIKQKISINKYTFELSAGAFVEYKTRVFSARSLGYTIKPGYTAYQLKHQGLDSIFDTTNVGGNKQFRMDETTSPSDAYKAQNLTAAPFVMLNLPIGNKVKISGGVRYEFNRQSLQSYVGQDSTLATPSITTHSILPSVNISYNFYKDMLFRVAYGKTLNRPEFREWSPFYFYDFEFKSGNYGSLYPTVYYPQGNVLKVATIQNVDVRYEWYPAPGDMIHVGGFFKHFTNPIQKVITPTGGSDSKGFTYINGDHAMAYGFEVDMRKAFTFIPVKALQDFSLVMNLAYIQSKLFLPTLVNQVKTNTLQGQAPYVINAGLYYQSEKLGLSGSVLYNVVGPRVFALGNADYGNIAEMPFHSLDLNLAYTVLKRLTFSFSAQNLIDSKSRLVLDIDRNGKYSSEKGDLVSSTTVNNGQVKTTLAREWNDQNIRAYKPGRYFTVGVKVKL